MTHAMRYYLSAHTSLYRSTKNKSVLFRKKDKLIRYKKFFIYFTFAQQKMQKNKNLSNLSKKLLKN